MKKVLFALFIVIYIFSLIACSSANVDSVADDSYLDLSLDMNSEKTVSLYFLSDNDSRLSAENRIITFDQNLSEEANIIKTLLEGPESENLKPYSASIDFDRIKILNNVANIYLKSAEPVSDTSVYYFAVAATNTLYDFSTVKYANFFINDYAISYNGSPVGTLTKSSTDLEENILNLEQQISSGSFLCTLYFFDDTETFILPEVRLINFTQGADYLDILTSELAKGPMTNYNYHPSVSSMLAYIDYETYTSSLSNQIITDVDFSKNPFKNSDTAMLTTAALTYSFSSFLSDCKNLRFSVNGNHINFTINNQKKYSDCLGNVISIYLPDSNKSHLKKTNITVPCINQNKAETILYSVLDNLNMIDVPGEMIKNVYVSDDIVIVDWDKKIKQNIKGLLSDKERLFIYSIVNSLVTLKDINKVQFLIDGNREESFAGYINIMDPLYQNPGLVK